MTTNTLLIVSVSPNGVGSGQTVFFALSGGDLGFITTETQAQTTMRDGGTFSHLYANCSANTFSTDGTFRTRKGAANATQTLTITASTAGEFEDTVNSDTVTAADKWNYTMTTGAGTGTCTIDSFSTLFAATTNTVTKNNCMYTFNLSAASTTSYGPLAGRCSASQTTETTEKTRLRKAGTMKFLMANVTTNTRAQASTAKSRLNGADGVLTKSITGSTTGIFEDTANTDTLAVADDYDGALVTGTSTGNLGLRPYSFSFISTADFGMVIGGASAGTTQLTNLTRFYKFQSNNVAATTENNTVQVKTRAAFTLSELIINVTAITMTDPSTLTTRKNAGAGAQTASITTSTGIFSDSVNTDVLVTTDKINMQLVTGVTGTSLAFVELGVWTTIAVAGGVSARPLTRAFNMSPYLSMNLGNQMAYGVNSPGGVTI